MKQIFFVIFLKSSKACALMLLTDLNIALSRSISVADGSTSGALAQVSLRSANESEYI